MSTAFDVTQLPQATLKTVRPNRGSCLRHWHQDPDKRALDRPLRLDNGRLSNSGKAKNDNEISPSHSMTAQARPIYKGKDLLAHMITQAKQRVQDVMEADCAPQQNREADVRTGSFSTEAAGSAARPTSASPRKLTSGRYKKIRSRWANERHHALTRSPCQRVPVKPP
jgi:hypothetical protein